MSYVVTTNLFPHMTHMTAASPYAAAAASAADTTDVCVTNHFDNDGKADPTILEMQVALKKKQVQATYKLKPEYKRAMKSAKIKVELSASGKDNLKIKKAAAKAAAKSVKPAAAQKPAATQKKPAAMAKRALDGSAPKAKKARAASGHQIIINM